MSAAAALLVGCRARAISARGDLLEIASGRWTTLANPEKRYVPGLPGHLRMSWWEQAYFTDDPGLMCVRNGAGALLVVGAGAKPRLDGTRLCLVPQPDRGSALPAVAIVACRFGSILAPREVRDGAGEGP